MAFLKEFKDDTQVNILSAMESVTTYEKLFPTFFNDVTLMLSDNLDAD